ncbi:hypothetical protein DFQ45_1057 [Thiopseudomonas denitrificans]|uniref:Uncharacterized protein n=1 Tax=Thiopseudomonas denitrificans TaxID=1501432 RepID=A0A4R6TXQ9_9GAMM|nr:hypothetical protein DFQ45_1057 [Thiopseudomonas denitrificans]
MSIMMAWLLQLRKKNLKMCPELVDHYIEPEAIFLQEQ